MTRVEMAPDWKEHVLAAWERFAGERLGPAIAADARRYAPVRTGRLRESIEHHLEGSTLVIEAHAPYAGYVELGTRPHLITAHGPWSLHNAATGGFFGREVHHPGTRPQPYLRPALYQVRGE